VRAGDSYGRALALRQESGDAAGEARLLARVAEAHSAQRRFEEALREYRVAFGIFRRLGDERGAALVGQALDRLQRQLAGEWNHPIAE
jgi:tetratricopeptide (TPR) repeat protein